MRDYYSPAFDSLNYVEDYSAATAPPLFNSRQATDFAVSLLDGLVGIPKGLVDTHNKYSNKRHQIENIFNPMLERIKSWHSDDFNNGNISNLESGINNVALLVPQLLALRQLPGGVHFKLGRRFKTPVSFNYKHSILDGLINGGQDESIQDTIVSSLIGGTGKSFLPIGYSMGIEDSRKLIGDNAPTGYNKWIKKDFNSSNDNASINGHNIDEPVISNLINNLPMTSPLMYREPSIHINKSTLEKLMGEQQ